MRLSFRFVGRKHHLPPPPQSFYMSEPTVLWVDNMGAVESGVERSGAEPSGAVLSQYTLSLPTHAR
jgi:hypothetical protein